MLNWTPWSSHPLFPSQLIATMVLGMDRRVSQVRASSTDLTFWTRSGVGWGGAQAGWMGRTGRWDARSSGVLEPEQGGGDVPPSLNYI